MEKLYIIAEAWANGRWRGEQKNRRDKMQKETMAADFGRGGGESNSGNCAVVSGGSRKCEEMEKTVQNVVMANRSLENDALENDAPEMTR
jgi:hypothetical protein